MRIRNHTAVSVVAGLVLAPVLTGCFTGVESTPKITPKEVRKQNIVDTPEQHVLDGITTTRPSGWAPGKRFYIADGRAVRVASRVSPLVDGEAVEGRMATLRSIDTVPTLTEQPEVRITLVVDSTGVELDFLTGLTPERWREATAYTLPHIVDMELVEAIRSRLVGKEYYILPARRVGSNGIDTMGMRYQPVQVLDVLPAIESAPVRVCLADREGHLSSVVMTVGDVTTSRRNFETLFSITDPRLRYKNITDENWALICRGRVREGMTPEECRLALGSPDTYRRIPTTAGMVERWTYSNGVYLLFEDGLLSSFRQ